MATVDVKNNSTLAKVKRTKALKNRPNVTVVKVNLQKEEEKKPEKKTSTKKENLIIALSTLGGLLVLAGCLTYIWTRPKPVEPPPPPEPVVIEKPVIQEKIVEVKVPVPQPVEVKVTPPPPPPPPPAPLAWECEGTWKHSGGRSAFPAFTLKQNAEGVYGTYAPLNATGLYRFSGGKSVEDSVEFSVTDQVGQTVWFCFTFKDSDNAKVEIWRLAEDILKDLDRVKTMRLTPQQRMAVIAALNKELKMAGKKRPIGNFKRVKDPGKEGPFDPIN